MINKCEQWPKSLDHIDIYQLFGVFNTMKQYLCNPYFDFFFHLKKFVLVVHEYAQYSGMCVMQAEGAALHIFQCWFKSIVWSRIHFKSCSNKREHARLLLDFNEQNENHVTNHYLMSLPNKWGQEFKNLTNLTHVLLHQFKIIGGETILQK